MNRLPARDLALVTTFAGLIAALGLVPGLYLFGSAVPITLQTLGVMLAGAILGPKRGFLACLLLLGLVALGLPLLAGGRGGLAVFAGPTVGYLVGWPIGALAIGWLTWRRGAPYGLPTGFAATVVGGVVVLHAVGIAGLMLVADLTLRAAVVTDVVFVPGDLAKAALTAVIARGVHLGYPGLLPRRADRREHAPV